MLYQRVTLVETPKGKFVVKYWDPKNHTFTKNWKNLPRFLTAEAKLLIYLNRKKFPAQYPIKTKTNRYIQKMNELIYMITKFVRGRNPGVVFRDVKIVGYYLGLLHHLTDSYKDIPERKLIDTIMTYRKDFRLLKDVIGRKSVLAIDNEIKKTISSFPELYSLESQKCVCHGHPCRKHFYIKNNKVSGIIDFDTSGIDYAVSDLGLAIPHFCFRGRILSPKLLIIFLRGYLAGRKIIHLNEIKSVYPSVRLALIEYTLWEINDSIVMFKRKPKINNIMAWKKLEHLNQSRNKETFEEIVKRVFLQ